MAVCPSHLRLQAMLRGSVEVALRGVEVEARLDGFGVVHQTAHHAQIRRRIGNAIADRRPGRHHPMFDPQMWFAIVVEAEQRPVPTPHRAVLEPHVGVLVRRFVRLHERQQNRVVALVLGEDLEQRPFRVAGAKRDPRRRAGPYRHRLLEERNARLLPQRMAEQKRRVGCQRDHGRGGRQGRVEIPRGPFRPALQVNLERCRGRFQHHVVVGHVQGVFGADADVQRIAVAQRQNAVVERLVAHQRGHVARVQQFRTNGRQDAHGGEPAAKRLRPGAAGLPSRRQLVVDARKDMPAQRRRAPVQLHVEGRQFRHDQRVVDGLEQLLIMRMRLPLGIDDPRLQLEAHDVAPVAEPVPLEQLPHQRRLGVQPPPKPTEVLGIEVPLAYLLSHPRDEIRKEGQKTSASPRRSTFRRADGRTRPRRTRSSLTSAPLSNRVLGAGYPTEIHRHADYGEHRAND